MAKALTIAGSDTSSGAGIQADLKVFSALHVYGTSVITALTAQNTRGVSRIMAVEPSMVKAQITAVLNDIDVDAIKIGMVYSRELINTVASSLKDAKIPIVLDPILRSGTGIMLLRNDAYTTFVKKLVPMADVITPNALEAEKLVNMKIRNIDEVKEAVRKITALGAENVVIKGGHMYGKHSIDVLYCKGEFFEFTNERIMRKSLHGTGCSFSAALTAEIAKGRSVVDATRKANNFVNNAIRNALKIGEGMRVPNFEHLAPSNTFLASLQRAVHFIEDTDDFGVLIPESQTNMVYAKTNAESIEDVAGVFGRIVKIGKKAKAAGNVGFGASLHVASAVLAIMNYNKSIRSAINIKYDERIIEICKNLGWQVSSYDRRKEPDEVKAKENMTVKWGIEQAVSKINNVPDVIYHTGDWGKEPMILLFGKDPCRVCTNVVSVLNLYKTSQ
ncbi:MAG: bifunctional hydroxymethylpyrimidine kinase/phosphomethylpyrimidine kinase [Nitrososphaerales archaeon]